MGWSIAVSLTNTILLLWLGFTILLNAERRSWGVWLIGGGLLTGGAFFISHTVILAFGLTTLGGDDEFLVVSRVWVRRSHCRSRGIRRCSGTSASGSGATPRCWRRHRRWYALNVPLALVLWLLLLFANPFPTFDRALRSRTRADACYLRRAMLVLLYMVCVLLSIGLSIDALLRSRSGAAHDGRSRSAAGAAVADRHFGGAAARRCFGRWVMLRVVVSSEAPRIYPRRRGDPDRQL